MPTSASKVPQMVSFEMEIRFDNLQRDASLPRSINLVFDCFDKMYARIRQEKRRRRIADRATSARYRMHLTAEGRRAIRENEYRAESHSDAINGTWFTW